MGAAAPGVGAEAMLGVRPHPPREVRRIVGAGGLLYLACGLSIVQLWATAAESEIASPGAYLASGIVVATLGSVVFVGTRALPDATVRTVFPATVLAMTFGGAVAVPAILWLCGFNAFAIGSVVYAILLIFGFWLLVRPLAVALLVTIALGHATLLAATDGVVAPIGQWLFLMVVLGAGGWLLGGLVDESDRAAASEAAARAELAEVNESLEQRVETQVDELERLSRLRRFLSPQVADAVVSAGSDAFLEAHRREIAVFFCDLRGFTSFASSVEPEDVVGVLNDYYAAIGEFLHKYEATVGSFAGDGIMAYFNDPEPCDRPALRAVEMALAMRDPMDELCEEWTEQGYGLGYGIGIALGHATLGVIGFEGRHDYTPLGTVVNLAARLCDEASTRQVLVDRRAHRALQHRYESRRLPDLDLKGFAEPVVVHEVRGDAVAGGTRR